MARKRLSLTISAEQEEVEVVRIALRDLYDRLDLPRPSELNGPIDIGRWEQSGGWYQVLGPDPWSQSGGWVLALNGRVSTSRVRPPELVLGDVRRDPRARPIIGPAARRARRNHYD